MNSKITIAHLIASNFFGGPEKQLVEHAGRLDTSRFALHLVSFFERGGKNQLIERATENGISAEAINSRGPFDPFLISRICQIIRDRKIKLLCVHGYKANILGRSAAWLAGIPVIAISRGWTGESPKIKIYEVLDKLFLRFADHVIAVSEGQRSKIISYGVDRRKVSVIHNSINLNNIARTAYNDIRAELGISPNAMLVISAGRLSPEKNYAGMIEVARVVAAKAGSFHFAVFGEGALREDLEARAKLAGLGQKFHFPGFRSNLQSILMAADIFMLPSFTEGLPNVVLEAFAARRPVVATAVGGTPEVVEDGVSGYLVQPHEVEKMADCLIRLADSPTLRETMGMKGYERVKEHFTFESQTAQYEELYARFAGLESAKKRRIS